jgi:hypothetical protein
MDLGAAVVAHQPSFEVGAPMRTCARPLIGTPKRRLPGRPTCVWFTRGRSRFDAGCGPGTATHSTPGLKSAQRPRASSQRRRKPPELLRRVARGCWSHWPQTPPATQRLRRRCTLTTKPDRELWRGPRVSPCAIPERLSWSPFAPDIEDSRNSIGSPHSSLARPATIQTRTPTPRTRRNQLTPPNASSNAHTTRPRVKTARPTSRTVPRVMAPSPQPASASSSGGFGNCAIGKRRGQPT